MRALVAAVPPEAGEPTTFEVTTALALDYFARRECELAVVEVGLGGRLDATNATDPFVSVITSISYDHTAILGHTLGAIATEKAGILRAGRPALLAEQRPAAERALRRACHAVGALCEVVPPFDGAISLEGAHQRQNAGLAVAAARLMTSLESEEVIRLGLTRLRWAGRFEVIDGAVPIVLDGAHNGASAEALARTLTVFAQDRPISLVVGINRDKDARAVVRPLLALAHNVWATQTRDNPRALDATTLGRLCRRLSAPRQRDPSPHSAAVHIEPDLATALKQAEQAGGIVCVTGSLLLVGQARAALGLSFPERLW